MDVRGSSRKFKRTMKSESNTMKALKWMVGGLRLAGRCAWEVLTLASPKADDAECGVDLSGQGR